MEDGTVKDGICSCCDRNYGTDLDNEGVPDGAYPADDCPSNDGDAA